jgi:hypothetical protein
VTPGEGPVELLGTWRLVRWEDRDCEDEAWLRAAERVR